MDFLRRVPSTDDDERHVGSCRAFNVAAQARGGRDAFALEEGWDFRNRGVDTSADVDNYLLLVRAKGIPHKMQLRI